MNETLSDEEIEREHKRDVENLAKMPRKEINAEAAHRYVEAMQLQNQLAEALNTIEALKAENEHLKSTMLKQPMSFELEDKDAQIKQLVEALELTKIILTMDHKNWYTAKCLKCGFASSSENFEGGEEDCICPKCYGNQLEEDFTALDVVEQALSTIPDVEGYRLEQKALDKGIDYIQKRRFSLSKGEDDLEYMDDSIALGYLITYLEALEAHREKVKNEYI